MLTIIFLTLAAVLALFLACRFAIARVNRVHDDRRE
jgi:hypothetical protein